MLLAQISDLHITLKDRKVYGLADSAATLKQVVAHILALSPRPDAVLATGDLADKGGADEYRHLAELLSPLPMPVYLMPGNHDRRGPLRTVFAGHSYLGSDGPCDYAVDAGPLRLIALDSLVEGEGGGQFRPEQAAWLERQLDGADDRPVLIAIHHPPVDSGVTGMDKIGLAGRERLLAITSRYPRVERILSGHLHRAMSVRAGASLSFTAPSTAFQLYLGLDPEAPPAFIMEPPSYALHLWRGGQLTTHVVQVGDFPGPYGGGKPVAAI